MSKFLSYYNLFPIPDPKEFLGLAADRENGNVVTTLARNVVVVLNVSLDTKISKCPCNKRDFLIDQHTKAVAQLVPAGEAFLQGYIRSQQPEVCGRLWKSRAASLGCGHQ